MLHLVPAALTLAALSEIVQPARLSELTAIDGKGGVLLYAFDASRRAVVVASGSRPQLSFEDFLPVEMSLPPLQDVRLSTDGETLLIHDTGNGRLFELGSPGGIRSHFSSSTLAGSPRCVLTAHLVGCTDSGERAILIFDRGSRDSLTRIPFPSPISAIEGLSHDRILVRQSSPPMLQEVRWTQAWEAREIQVPVTDAASFTVRNGIFYVLEDGAVSIREKSADAQILRQRTLPDAREVAVSKSFLYVSDGFVVQRTERLEPAAVSLEAPGPGNTIGLRKLLGYLRESGITASVQVDAPPTALEDLFAVAADASRPWADSVYIATDHRDSIAAEFCLMNQRGCTSESELLAWLGTGPPSIIVPYLRIMTSSVSQPAGGPENQSAFEILESLPPELRATVTLGSILRSESKRTLTLESEALARDYSLSPDPVSRYAGQFFSSDSSARAHQLCATPDIRRSATVVAFPNGIVSSRPAAVLPHSGRELNAAKLKEFGIIAVRIGFERAVQEEVPLAELMSQIEGPSCAALSDTPGYFVSQSLRLDHPRFQLLGPGGAVITPRPKELAALRLNVKLEGSWLVPAAETPAYVAHKRAQVGAISSDLSLTGTPTLPEDWLPDLTGQVRLPMRTWAVWTFVRSRDLDEEASPLGQMERESPITILSARELVSAIQSIDDQVSQAEGGVLAANRQQLFSYVRYPTASANVRVDVGVAEACSSLDFTHPDLGTFDDRAWQPLEEVCKETHAPEARRIRPARDEDHGSHVAGLLAARASSIAPGLLPAARLHFIERETNVARFHKEVSAAGAEGMRVVNCSFTWLDSEERKTLRKPLRNWKDRYLFVVASGNRAKLVADTVDTPVLWTKELKNVLTVGASDLDHKKLSYLDAGMEKGTSYGLEYVDLFAPGLQVISTASGGAYTTMSGSSQAVPLVSATAALLARTVDAPSHIKARLLYTAHFTTTLNLDVWAGELDAERALREPHKNQCATQTDERRYRDAAFDSNSLISIGGLATSRKRQAIDPISPDAPASLLLRNVLRIQLQADGSYRLFYLDPTRRLQVVEGASLSGRLMCDSPDDPLCDADGFLDVSQVHDYVARVPDGEVHFHEADL